VDVIPTAKSRLKPNPDNADPDNHYNRKKVYIRAVLTHSEYDEGQWKE